MVNVVSAPMYDAINSVAYSQPPLTVENPVRHNKVHLNPWKSACCAGETRPFLPTISDSARSMEARMLDSPIDHEPWARPLGGRMHACRPGATFEIGSLKICSPPTVSTSTRSTHLRPRATTAVYGAPQSLLVRQTP